MMFDSFSFGALHYFSLLFLNIFVQTVFCCIGFKMDMGNKIHVVAKVLDLA